jgi:hypothetical protein
LSDLWLVTHSKSVSQLWVYRALFVHDFLVLCLVVPRFLATQIALNGHDLLVCLALLVVPQVAIAISLLIVVALGKAVILLVLLVSPPCQHVTQLYGSSRAIAPEVVVRVFREKPVLEAADDVFVGDVGDVGACLEETPYIGPQGLIHLLLRLG